MRLKTRRYKVIRNGVVYANPVYARSPKAAITMMAPSKVRFVVSKPSRAGGGEHNGTKWTAYEVSEL